MSCVNIKSLVLGICLFSAHTCMEGKNTGLIFNLSWRTILPVGRRTRDSKPLPHFLVLFTDTVQVDLYWEYVGFKSRL